MNISSMTDGHISSRNNIPDKAEIAAPETQPGGKARHSELSQLTDSASLTALPSRIQAILNEIAGPDDNVLHALTANVTCLQDAFIDTLYSLLTRSEVDLSQKLTLRLDTSGALALAGEHPDGEAVKELLHDRPDLSAAFREIASQSEVMRDIRNIGKVMCRQSGPEQYARMAEAAASDAYRMSMKGDMSHFYFSQR